MTSFRAARVDEDDELSRILCNAFLPLWNHNWFHSISEPLDPVPINPKGSRPMTTIQQSRVQFYLSLIKLTRLLGGHVSVASVPDSSDNTGQGTEIIGAILLFLPPHHRLKPLDLSTLWQSGFLSLTLPWRYGLTGLYRINSIFEANVQSMFAETLPKLPPSGFCESECGFVQMLASNPRFAGLGYASALLKWQMEKHFVLHPSTPVILDTSTQQGIRAYERLGFKLLARTAVDTGTDAGGIRLKADADQKTREAGRNTCVQSVMAKIP